MGEVAEVEAEVEVEVVAAARRWRKSLCYQTHPGRGTCRRGSRHRQCTLAWESL